MVPGYRQRYQLLKSTEEERNSLIEELLIANDSLKVELEKVQNRLERENDAIELYQKRSKDAKSELKALQDLTDSSTYACVLIDGEEIFFKDQFCLEGATRGGKEVARLLHSCIKEHISGLRMRHDCDLIVHMYANIYTLAKKYRIAHEDLDRFVNGFNMFHPLINIIEAGHEHGSVKRKIGEMFGLHIKNVHCKHLVLGASTSDRCGAFLKIAVGNKALESRITLLKGPPFSQELADLSRHFKTTSFTQLFRSTEIQSQAESTIQDHHRSTLDYSSPVNHKAPEDRFLDSLERNDRRNSTNDALKNGSEEDRGGRDRERKSSFRDVTNTRLRHDEDASDLTRRASDSAKVVYSATQFKDAPFGFVARNRRGQRVDVPLSKPDSRIIYDIKQSKLCNDHVFRKKCANDPCKHQHPSILTDEEFRALRDIARHVPCLDGLRCNDMHCHSGHRCPVDPCGFVQDQNCRFPPNLHDIDTGIVNIEDYERFIGKSYDETRILGITNRPKKDSTEIFLESKTGEASYRHKSIALDDATQNELTRANLTLGNSIFNAPKKLPISNPTPAAPTTTDQMSPLKRTADEANVPSREMDVSASLARDPRVGAQKRLRGITP